MNRPPEELFLDLLIDCLTRRIFEDATTPRYEPVPDGGSWRRNLIGPARALLRRRGIELVRRQPATATLFSRSDTLTSTAQLTHLRQCIAQVLHEGVPGDLIETGVWRGAVGIFMRAALEAYGDDDRVVWMADSFKGLPKPDGARYPQDTPFDLSPIRELAVSRDEVVANCIRYGHYDHRVRFIEGWFKDTLASAPIERLAILRLDGDLYESTTAALSALYPKLSVGGYLLIDDYGIAAPCRDAVHDYRAAHGITEALLRIDYTGAFWRRER